MRAVRTMVVIVMSVACVFVACDRDSGDAVPTTTPPAGALPTIDLRYDGGTLRVEVAVTPDDRAQGLGGRDALAEDAGMLFDLGSSRVPGFWMKGMRFPIDMVWIDEAKTVVGVALDVQPQPGAADSELRRYSPASAVRYVLEINAGSSLALGIEAGDRVEFVLPGSE